MSDSSAPIPRPTRNPSHGGIPIAISLLLTIAYFGIPRMTMNWTVQGHIIFRGLVILIGLTGVVQLFAATANFRIRFPAWLRLSQHWMSVPLEGWFYLGIMFVLFTGAMLTKQNTLLLVFAFMAGPFVINGWMTFGMLQSARVRRLAPDRAMQGELFNVELTLNNTHRLFAIWMMSIRDEVSHSSENLNPSILFSRVSPRSSQTGQYQLRLAKRGRYRMSLLNVSSRFPLGLVERSRVFSAKQEMLIYPRIGRISPNWRERLVGATELVSKPQLHHGVFHDDFHRLREFRSGDNPRAIHWRSTARRGELILREFHQNRDQTLAILLDLYSPPSPNSKSLESVEFALSFVCSLIVDRGRECRDGFLTLAASGKEVFRWEAQGNLSGLEVLFDGLALFEAGPAVESVELLSGLLRHSASSTQILIVTTRTTELPYQSLLTSRVDVLKMSEVPADALLLFGDE